MAAEITLGATALFAPLLHAIRLCYNVKKLSDGFGEDMVTYERRLRSQLAILEVLFDTNLSQLASEEIQRSVSQGPTKPDKVGGVAKTICSELDSMRNNTRICCDLMNEYSGYHKST